MVTIITSHTTRYAERGLWRCYSNLWDQSIMWLIQWRLRVCFAASRLSSCIGCNYMAWHHTHWSTSPLQCHYYSNLWAPSVARSEDSQIPFGYLLKTFWTFSPKIGFERESDWNQICLQSECSLILQAQHTPRPQRRHLAEIILVMMDRIDLIVRLHVAQNTSLNQMYLSVKVIEKHRFSSLEDID